MRTAGWRRTGPPGSGRCRRRTGLPRWRSARRCTNLAGHAHRRVSAPNQVANVVVTTKVIEAAARTRLRRSFGRGRGGKQVDLDPRARSPGRQGPECHETEHRRKTISVTFMDLERTFSQAIEVAGTQPMRRANYPRAWQHQPHGERPDGHPAEPPPQGGAASSRLVRCCSLMQGAPAGRARLVGSPGAASAWCEHGRGSAGSSWSVARRLVPELALSRARQPTCSFIQRSRKGLRGAPQVQLRVELAPQAFDVEQGLLQQHELGLDLDIEAARGLEQPHQHQAQRDVLQRPVEVRLAAPRGSRLPARRRGCRAAPSPTRGAARPPACSRAGRTR